MPDIIGLYYALTVASMLFHLEQVILLIVIYEDGAGYKFRGSKIKGHGNLKPIANTAKVALFIFSTTLVIVPIAGYLFYDIIIEYTKTLEYHFLILPSGFLGAFFFIWHYMIKKKWNKAQVTVLILSFVLMSIVFGMNYHDVVPVANP